VQNLRVIGSIKTTIETIKQFIIIKGKLIIEDLYIKLDEG